MDNRSDQRRYRILHVLGKGGFGTVYRAELQGSGGFRKEVALKVLNEEVASKPDVVQRLRDEARMLGMLRHRAIVTVDALAHLDGRWTIVMEYVDGASLRDVLGLGPLPVSAALEIVEEVAAALDVAFTSPGENQRVLGLLHRDIKPGNIQLTARGEVKLLDFGVAKADFGDREAHTRSLIFGSIHYLAPERLDFEDTHKGDIYALGCTLYEMLVGEQLPKASINPRKHRDKVNEARRAVLKAHKDPDLAELVERCLEYEPEDRPDARTLERRARAIRRGYPEPWLRDWAEQAVPRAQSHRSAQDDQWSGSVIQESGSLNNTTLALFADDGALDDEAPATLPPPPPVFRGPEPAPLSRVGPAPVPPRAQAVEAPAPAPVTAPTGVVTPSSPPAQTPPRRDPKPPPRRRPAKERPRKRPRIGRWLLGIGITLAVLLIVLPTVAVVATTGGLYALLESTGILSSAWDETVRDTMKELEQQVQPCSATLERDDILALLRRNQTPGSGDTISLLELVEFEQMVEEAAVDRVIDEVETIRIQEKWAYISRD